MIKSLSVLPVVLIFATCNFNSLSKQLTCQNNGCDSCCTTSDFCSTEHTIVSEDEECGSPPLPLEAPLIPGLEQCPFDFYTYKYGACPNSHVDDKTKSVGDYGKPDWVGAEFQSISYNIFSMTVMWEHTNAEILSTLPDLSPVQGYEIRIYEKEAGRPEVVRQCFCVTDPSMRNISNIRGAFLEYKEMSHMIVEVRTFPSLIGEDERNTWRNCSLLTRCAMTSATEDCFISRDECYSWPQSCLDFLPFYDPLTCAPPLYGPPVNVKAVIILVDDKVVDSDNELQLYLSWEPPIMNYWLFPVPEIYYVIIESDNSTFRLRARNTTNITISPLHFVSVYRVFVSAYVPCSGLSQSSALLSYAGCGNSILLRVETSCGHPIPPFTWLARRLPFNLCLFHNYNF